MKKKVSLKTLVYEQKIIIALSVPLSALLIVCSTVGLLYPEIYEPSTPNWLTQTVVQDGVNLFLITPVLLVAGLYAFQGVKFAFLMWGGTVGYVAYTFIIYCFSVHFNVLFPVYTLVLGLSIFSLLWFVMTQARMPVVSKLDNKPLHLITGIYFIAISSFFYALWLVEVIPAALSNQVPKSLSETGLMTNPVQVIDLSVFLPLVFISGVMSLRSNPFAATLIPVILIFFILMDLTIAALTMALLQNNLRGSPVIAVVMPILALFSIMLLIMFVRSTTEELSN